MYCKNTISHHKNPKVFAPAAGSSLLLSPCKTVMHFFFVNSNPEQVMFNFLKRIRIHSHVRQKELLLGTIFLEKV